MVCYDEFTKLVVDVLRHYYDLAHLQPHPLCELVLPSSAPDDLRAQGIRECVLTAIEAIKPETTIPFGDPEWFPYLILRREYIEGCTRQEVCQELSVSERTFYRYHKAAIESVCTILWDRYQQQTSTTHTGDVQPTAVGLHDEAMRVMARSWGQRVDVALTIADVQGTVEPLLTARGNALQSSVPGVPLYASMVETILRQIIVNCILLLNARVINGTISVIAQDRKDRMELAFGADHVSHPLQDEDSKTVRTLAEALLGHVVVQPTEITVSLPFVARRSLLVLDDDQDILPLLQRYLGAEYAVLQAVDVSQLIELLESEVPDVILLDILMPHVDGWQVLQRLRNRRETRHIPIVVCSILGDQNADLAMALGASAVLPKPFSQEDLLAAIRPLSASVGNPAKASRPMC